MSLTYSPQLKKAMLKRRASGGVRRDGTRVSGWNVQQFGQAADYYTFGGATGCTHVVLQWLVYLWKGRKVTQDDVSRACGYPLPGNNPGRRGLRPYEVQRAIAYYGLPYKVVFGLSASEVLTASKDGPVGFGHVYGYWPDWKGYYYGGTRADGRPNGFATPSGRAGRTQLTGFERGAHFGMVLGVAIGDDAPDLVYAFEPNHGSAARPEKPAYDRMTRAQLAKVYGSYTNVLGRSPYAIVPVQKLPARGY